MHDLLRSYQLNREDCAILQSCTLIDGINLQDVDGGTIPPEGNTWLSPYYNTLELTSTRGFRTRAHAQNAVIQTVEEVYGTILDEGNPTHDPSGRNYTRVTTIRTGPPPEPPFEPVPAASEYVLKNLWLAIASTAIYLLRNLRKQGL